MTGRTQSEKSEWWEKGFQEGSNTTDANVPATRHAELYKLSACTDKWSIMQDFREGWLFAKKCQIEGRARAFIKELEELEQKYRIHVNPDKEYSDGFSSFEGIDFWYDEEGNPITSPKQDKSK